MSLTALVGPPGAGKTTYAIDQLEDAAAQGRPTYAIVCADVARSTDHGRLLGTGRFYSRSRRSWPIDAMVREGDLPERIASIAPGTLVVIEDAYGFPEGSAVLWEAASRRGVELLLVAPSGGQMAALSHGAWTRVDLTRICDRCGERPGVRPLIEHVSGLAATYCEACFGAACDEATAYMRRILKDGGPYEGTEHLYQPIEVAGFEDWKVVRVDSARRAEAMYEVLRDLGLSVDAGRETYLDMGCLTGFFCDYFAQRGLVARGIDVTRSDIEVARILENFYRRPTRPNPVFVVYEQHDGYDYLEATQDDLIDVTSSLAVFQWIMLQRKDAQVGIDCIRLLANKTRRVMFLEMGYTDEDIYRDKLPVEIDRDWVQDQLRQAGFGRTMVLDRSSHGIRRDIHVGIR